MSDYIVPGTDIDIQSLPKISLHDHLYGGLRPSTILELADSVGASIPEDPTTGKAIDSSERLGQWFADQADSGSLVEYLKTFDVTLSVMQTAEGLTRIGREFVEDLVDEAGAELSAGLKLGIFLVASHLSVTSQFLLNDSRCLVFGCFEHLLLLGHCDIGVHFATLFILVLSKVAVLENSSFALASAPHLVVELFLLV